ncbi:MAG: hypothetical protein BWY17_01234 [Deltaproteobacteria bacterium ADurb.Bin207]|nr:MAG: hypothetical protein BWY17_01234 [Deltaproteobacteria bacterium ADurb.Bin207]
MLVGQARHRFQQVPHITTNIASVRLQRYDRISHELPRPVIRDIAAPGRGDEVDATGRERLLRYKHVFVFGTSSKSNDRAMLEQQDDVTHQPLLTRDKGLLLQFVYGTIAPKAKPINSNASGDHVGCSLVVIRGMPRQSIYG